MNGITLKQLSNPSIKIQKYIDTLNESIPKVSETFVFKIQIIMSNYTVLYIKQSYNSGNIIDLIQNLCSKQYWNIYTVTNKSAVTLSKALCITRGLISFTALLLKAPGKFILVQVRYCHYVQDIMLYYPSKITWQGDSIFHGKYCILLYNLYMQRMSDSLI